MVDAVIDALEPAPGYEPPTRGRRAPRRAAAAVTAPLAGASATSPAQRALRKLGLLRDIDLALHLPLRHQDETRLTPVAALRDGVAAQVEGDVVHVEVRSGGQRRQLLLRLRDTAGDDLLLRFLHFYPSQQRTMAHGARLRVVGEPRGGFFGVEMVHPACRRVEADTPLPTTLTPVYPSTAGLPQAYLRRAVASALARADLAELVPPALRPPGADAWPTLRAALEWLHHPPPGDGQPAVDARDQPAWRRLQFDELLAQQLSQLQARQDRATQRAPQLRTRRNGLPDRLLAALPFALTAAQRRVADEIAADLQRRHGAAVTLGPYSSTVPMHRLLQGDVGSGKTVVAALAAAIAIDAGWQCALMAPTELLAEQHFRKLVDWLLPLGVGVAWLTGSRRGRQRDAMLAQVVSGKAALVVGTHAVIQHDVHFARLGLAIVDEQHRFGVAQRLALRQKLGSAATAASVGEAPSSATSGHCGRRRAAPPGGAVGTAQAPMSDPDAPPLQPHLLMMSATPIPRTLAMTLFADLDLSTLDELPPGRTPVTTRVFDERRRDAVVARIRDAVAEGRQVYWVCPLVEESEHVDLQNATATQALLTAALPGEVTVGLLHGRMKAADKQAVMAAFCAGRIGVLVATTVIEVGIDVPNASLMVIDHAERFGLSQLHQLRGRVGRGAVASACVLLYGGPLSQAGRARLKAMAETGDGFEIARRDLQIRGPGEFLGARQSGAPLLRFSDPVLDAEAVTQARAVAEAMLEQHPALAARHVARWLGDRSDYLDA